MYDLHGNFGDMLTCWLFKGFLWKYSENQDWNLTV